MSDANDKMFDRLRKHPEFPDDPDLRLDDVGFVVERHSHGAIHSFGWRVEKCRVIGNVAGKPPLMD